MRAKGVTGSQASRNRSAALVTDYRKTEVDLERLNQEDSRVDLER